MIGLRSNIVFLLAILLLETSILGQGLSSSDQKKEFARLRDVVTEAGKQYKDEKYDEAGKLIVGAISDLTKIAAQTDPRSRKMFEPIHQRLAVAHQMLSIQGFELPPLPPLDAMAVGNSNATSFVRDIAPWMVSQCGGCHIQRSSGNFSLATFADLMKGSTAGVVLFPKDPKGSRIVEVIESGDMPRGNGKVSPENLEKLKKWIAEGATFDGSDVSQRLPNLVSSSAPTSAMSTAKDSVARPTGRETVSFAKDIAPILLEQCIGCHINARRAQGGLSMDTFAQLLRGGDSGAIVSPRDSDRSELIKRLRGESGNRMPQGKPPLSEERIKLIATWIDENASFDGTSKDARIAEVIELAWVRDATDDELRDRRRQRGHDQWKLVLPNAKADEASDEDFLVLGDLGPGQAADVLKEVQDAARTVKKQLKVETKDPLVRGGIVVFAFSKRYDYGEYGKMVENRTLPNEWSGHWKKRTLDAYIVLHYESGTKNHNRPMLLQLLSSLHLGSLKDVPSWFAEGAGRSLVASTVNDDPRVRQWMSQMPSISVKLKDPKDLLDSKLGEEDAAITGLAFCQRISSPAGRKQYDQLLRALHNGISFDEAFSSSYGPLEAFLRKWLGLPAKR